MSENKSTRDVTLSVSSWSLLDEAASLWGGSADEVLESVLASFREDDGGTLIERQLVLQELKKLWGVNRG